MTRVSESAPQAARPATWSRPARLLDRAVALVDNAGDRLWSSGLNPLHQSGTIAIVSFATLAATGIFLFLFYSIDSPWQSVSHLERDIPLGSWVRTVHAYAADLALVATMLHALKMFLAGRCFGPRKRAWLTGLVLLGITLLCGWTGQVMAWDLQGQVVAVELTRLLDLLPVFSMPMGRAFDGLAPVPASFFFMNLFLHVCLPLGLAMVLWLHVARIARPVLFPPRPLLWTMLGALAIVAALVRVRLAPPADLLAMPRDVPVDVLYNFWLAAAWRVSPAQHALMWLAVVTAAFSVPWWWPRARVRREPSWVDPDHCTGCTTCYKDCPFDAIAMVARPDPGRRSEFHALVYPERCVSCGICAGSCAPMSVGPPRRTGREQLQRERERIAAGTTAPIVVFACAENAAADDPRLAAFGDVCVRKVECAGAVHTSVLDLALRGGAEGVFVLACPPRTAPCREGAKWLHERVYNNREAELPPRVDKRRIAIVSLSRGEWSEIAAALGDFRERLKTLPPPAAGKRIDALEELECEPELEVQHG